MDSINNFNVVVYIIFLSKLYVNSREISDELNCDIIYAL